MNTSSLNPALSAADQTDDLDVEVVHWYWVKDPTAAIICGAPSDSPRPTRPHIVQTVGGMMAVTKPADCPDCVRLFEQHIERRRLRYELHRIERERRRLRAELLSHLLDTL